MKRFMSLALVVVSASAFFYNFFASKTSMPTIMLDENVEALTQGEAGAKQLTCYNTITKKDGCMVRYCQTCRFTPGTDPWYAPSNTCSE